MKCPVCNAKTKVTRTYFVSNTSRTTERVCKNGHTLVFQTIFVCEPTRRGEGAYALAQKLKKG